MTTEKESLASAAGNLLITDFLNHDFARIALRETKNTDVKKATVTAMLNAILHHAEKLFPDDRKGSSLEVGVKTFLDRVTFKSLCEGDRLGRKRVEQFEKYLSIFGLSLNRGTGEEHLQLKKAQWQVLNMLKAETKV